jgi:spermidine synthase
LHRIKITAIFEKFQLLLFKRGQPVFENNIVNSRRHTMLIFIAFFSGVSTLIYQIVWVKLFGLVFGVSVYAVSTVLTTFMAGLAFGSLIFGKIVDRYRKPLKLLLWLELGLAVYAIAFHMLFRGLLWAYPWLHRLVPMNFYGQSLVRFILSFLLLIGPTLCMGGILPVLSKCLIRKMSEVGTGMGRLYGMNNLGAFLGCFLSGFFLVYWMGSSLTLFTGAAINVLNGLIIWVLLRYPSVSATNETVPADLSSRRTENDPCMRPVRHLVLWAFTLEGFSTLAYEVIWTRLFLSYSHDRSVYFYTTIILAFIFGLSAGSFLIARSADRKSDILGRFAWIETGIGILALASFIFIPDLGRWIQHIRLTYTEQWTLTVGREYLIFFLICVPPVILMGMTFPLVSKMITEKQTDIGKNIGLIGCLDTVGSIFGAFAAGFVLLPLLGIKGSLLFTAGINLLIGIGLMLGHPGWSAKKRTFIPAVVILFSVLLGFIIPDEKAYVNYLTRQPGDRMLYYREGISAMVAVPQHVDGIKELVINGATTAWSMEDEIRVHLMMSYLPYIFHTHPENGLVIGMGMGVTAHALNQADIERVDCVEIAPEVFKAAEIAFAKENQNICNQKKFHRIVEDGRSYLLVTDTQYDIINSNAVHPRHSIHIYTREFYKLCRLRLREDGLMLQWLPTNWYTEEEFKILIRACLDIFPETSLWVISTSQVLLLSEKNRRNISVDQIRKKLSIPGIQHDLRPFGLQIPEYFLAQYVCDGNTLLDYVGNGPSAIDDKSRVEFSHVVNKARNPDILKSLIGLKEKCQVSERGIPGLILPDTDLTKIERYLRAETAFMRANAIELSREKPERMIELLTEAIHLMPENPRYHEALSVVAYRSGQTRSALESILQVIALRPDHADSFERLGQLLIEMNDVQNAAQAFRQTLLLEPDRPLSRYYLAAIDANAEAYDQAIHELEKAREAFPEYAPIYHLLGQIYLQMGKSREALAALKQYLVFNHGAVDSTIQNQISQLKHQTKPAD